jgi:ABC-type transport system involved in cytochrome c biogenesis permease subunit
MTHRIFTVATVLLVAPQVLAQGSAGAHLPETLDLRVVRGIVTQHDGRWPPLDSVARDLVREVTGRSGYQGHDSVLWLLAWTFDPQTWMRQPLIPIGNAELREALELPQSRTAFSYLELVSHERLRQLFNQLANRESGTKPDPLESKVDAISSQLFVLQGIFEGRAIRLIPDPRDASAAWEPIGEAVASTTPETASVVAAWEKLREAFLADDAERFTAAAQLLRTRLSALPAAHRPSPELIATELRYNRLQPFRTAWIVMVVAAILAAAATGVRRRWFDGVVLLALLAGFGVLTYGLSLRWTIAGRIPASNMFESLLFLSWGMGAFAIVSMLIFHQRLVPLTAAVMGAVSLMLADLLPMDPSVRPIPPVLRDTIWMSVHVPVIMVSYSVLALGVLIAHVQLATMAAVPGKRRLIHTVDQLHYWYIHVGSILLFVGVVTGSMWAAYSWGRYWGWDPKEVWSLVALLAYLTILHVRIDYERVPRWAYVVGLIGSIAVFAVIVPKLAPLTSGKIVGLVGAAVGTVVFVMSRGRFGTALKSVVAFWLIIMTYVGVNYVLGIGLHSYGFGTGAVVRYMFLLGTIDLSFIALCALVYYGRMTFGPGRQEQPLEAAAA